MTKEKSVYLSFQQDVYKKNKTTNLNAQVDVINSLKHLENLKVLGKKKNELKMRMQRLFENVLEQIESLDKKLPEPKIPKKIKEKLSEPSKDLTEAEIATKELEKNEDLSELDKEIQEIQQKLRQLNT